MNLPAITALATGVPETRYSQREIFDYMESVFERKNSARAIFERAGVDFRHMVVDEAFYGQEQRTGARNERYLAHAVPLGEATIRRCLASARLDPTAVTDFLVVSCTGLDIPGLDLRLAARLGMRPELRRTCVLGMGCYAAFPALLRASEAVAQRAGRTALVLALELCSLHWQAEDSLENIVVSALFADGAAAALIQEAPSSPNGTGPRLLDSATFCDYSTSEHMAFHVTDYGFRMRLSAYVPEILAANIEDFVDGLLGRNDLRRGDVSFWGIHPGGSKILDSIQARLGLTEVQMDYSRAVLRRYGNMSSPTILFVLEDIQCRGQPAPGDYGVLLAFGPGLTMESALIQW